MVFGQYDTGSTKRVRFNNIRARLKVLPMDVENNVRSCLYQVLIAAFERRTAEIVGSQVPLLQHGAHCPIQHENAALEGLVQRFATLRWTIHIGVNLFMLAGYEHRP